MEVRIGWSGGTLPDLWRKIDVTLDEDDFARLLGVLPGAIVLRKLNPLLVFKVLVAEAHIAVMSEVLSNGWTSNEYVQDGVAVKYSDEIEKKRQVVEKMVAAIRDKYDNDL